MSNDNLPDLKAIRKQCQDFAKLHLAACCAELLEWQDAAILCDGRVRELAALCNTFVGNHDGLRVAESFINRAAVEAQRDAVAASGAGVPAQELLAAAKHEIARLKEQLFYYTRTENPAVADPARHFRVEGTFEGAAAPTPDRATEAPIILLQSNLKSLGWSEVSEEQYDAYSDAGYPVRRLYCHTTPDRAPHASTAGEGIEDERANFEDWYVTHVDGAKIGSGDCAARWSAWVAGSSRCYKAPGDWKIAPMPWSAPAAAEAPDMGARDAALDECAAAFNGASIYNISESQAIKRICALKSQPAPAAAPAEAATDDDDADEAAQILNALIENIERDGNYSQEATLCFLGQLKQCVDGLLANRAGSAK